MAGDSEKGTPWWNQEVKEAIRAKKDAFKAWLQDRSSSDLQFRYTEVRKAATLAVKKSKKKSWKEFGCWLDSNHFSASKVFWQTIRRLRGKRLSITCSIKDSAGNILSDENEILSRWRKYFEDLLNPVKASTCNTHEVTHLGEDEVFTAAEVATATKGIKSGKAAGEDEIRPEMLKALTWRRNSLVNASVSSCVEVWQNSQRLANRCDYSDIQERRSQAMYKLQRDITP